MARIRYVPDSIMDSQFELMTDSQFESSQKGQRMLLLTLGRQGVERLLAIRGEDPAEFQEDLDQFFSS